MLLASYARGGDVSGDTWFVCFFAVFILLGIPKREEFLHVILVPGNQH